LHELTDHLRDILITGAAGTIGSILAPALAGEGSVTGLDVVEPGRRSHSWRTVQGDVCDRELLMRYVQPGGIIVHLATGAYRGWEGLLDVDILGTTALFDVAAEVGTGRVILASTNHVVGGFELDYFRRGVAPGLGMAPAGIAVRPTDPIRPDSQYGAANAFGEAYGRFVAETTATAVSCLRIGTVAPVDDPNVYAASPQFAHIPGGAEGAGRRLRATWLYHADLLRIVREELAASDRFRLRFAVSDNPGRFWSLETYRWNPH
jgi:nucleoside-diphosphate-sugar epimerase